MFYFVSPTACFNTMRKILLVSIILLLNFEQIIAQKEATHWYFGNAAGLTFKAGIPEPHYESGMNTYEGCAAYSNAKGELLFYTNGVQIWNADHELMENGDGLAGDTSSTQSALIVPNPADSNLYYLFTSDVLDYSEGEIYTQGLRYSVIDMTLDSGNGAVTEKNVLLLEQVPEKITAVQKAQDSAYWVISHEWGNNNFAVWLIDENGIASEPVISSAGTAHVQIQDHNIINSIGTMKVNPQGNRLALALLRASLVEIFTFDSQTGMVSEAITVEFDYQAVYGVEFSPDGSKLYITSIRSLYQVDLEAGTPEDVAASLTEIFEESYFMGTMQLAPNGKIYCTVDESDRLGIIHNPNASADHCAYESGALQVGNGSLRMGLPNFISSLFLPPDFYVYPVCYGTETVFHIADTIGTDSVLWNFGDPLSGSNNTSKVFNPAHLYNDTGTYTVELKRWISGVETRLSQEIQIDYAFTLDLGPDTILCDTDNYTIQLPEQAREYLWYNNDSLATHNFSETGTYWAEGKSTYTGCRHSDTVSLIFSESPPVDLGQDTLFCSNSIFVLEPEVHCDTCVYTWQDSSTESRFYPETEGYYSLQITNEYGCSNSDTVFLDIKHPPVFELGNDTVLCDDAYLFLSSGWENAEYIWQDGSESFDYYVDKPGLYALKVKNICGEYTDSIRITYEYCGPLKIPNVISPNGDGINDYFFVKGIDQLKWQLSVYTRWGNRVYHSLDYKNNWSPEKLSSGVYYYILQSAEIGAEHKGFVHVIK
jgi:gliding motility-associated-like protein